MSAVAVLLDSGFAMLLTLWSAVVQQHQYPHGRGVYALRQHPLWLEQTILLCHLAGNRALGQEEVHLITGHQQRNQVVQNPR